MPWRVLSTVLLVVVLAGCSSAPPGGDAASDADSAGPLAAMPAAAPAANASVPAPPAATLEGAHLGRTAQTPVVEFGPGSWHLTFDGSGTRQFVVRLLAGISSQGYSVSGDFTIALLPLDLEFAACEESGVPLLSTHAFGLSETWLQQLAAGDYLAVFRYEEDASATFTWNVGDSDEAREHDADGEASPWSLRMTEAQVQDGAFVQEMAGGLHWLVFRGSTGPAAMGSSIAAQVADGQGVCAQEAGETELQPLGGSPSVALQVHAAGPVTWSGQFSEEGPVDPLGAPTATAVTLVPPA